MTLRLISAIFLLGNLTPQAQNEEKTYELERLNRQRSHIRQILTYEFDLAPKSLLGNC